MSSVHTNTVDLEAFVANTIYLTKHFYDHNIDPIGSLAHGPIYTIPKASIHLTSNPVHLTKRDDEINSNFTKYYGAFQKSDFIMSFFVLLTSILILLLSIPLFYRTKWWRDGLEQVCFRRIPINALSISSLPSNFSMLLTPVLRISLSRPISTMSFFLNHLKSHTLVTLPIPEKKFTGKTIIVTGSNSGLGLEAARWFVCICFNFYVDMWIL